MIKFKTSRFGDLEVEKDKVINFPTGLVGFPDINRFILIDHRDTPLKWLQALDDPEIAFIVVPPSTIVAEYNIELDKTVKQYLELENNDDLAVLVTIRVNGDDVIANFQGPIVINSRSMTGAQLVLDKPNKSYHNAL